MVCVIGPKRVRIVRNEQGTVRHQDLFTQNLTHIQPVRRCTLLAQRVLKLNASRLSSSPDGSRVCVIERMQSLIRS